MYTVYLIVSQLSMSRQKSQQNTGAERVHRLS